MNNAIILQQAYTPDAENSGYFYDMLRLTMNRHAAYARVHKMDYQVYFGEYLPERNMFTGAWHKIRMIQDAIDKGYEYIFWLDTDAGIADISVDLRDAFSGDGDIGACEHESKTIPRHYNVGVLFVRNTDRSKNFIADWWNTFPGDERWLEQGSFNNMAKDNPVVFRMDDKWNATISVNEVDNPVVKGWHGILPSDRFNAMRRYFKEDHIKYRV